LPVPLPGLPVSLSSMIPLIPPDALPLMLLPATNLDNSSCQGAAGVALPHAAPSAPSTTGAPPPPHAAPPTSGPVTGSGRAVRIP
jgi:hypothetical protein